MQKDPKSKDIKKNKNQVQMQKAVKGREKSQSENKVGLHSDPKCKVYIEDLLSQGCTEDRIRDKIARDFKSKAERTPYYTALTRFQKGKTVINKKQLNKLPTVSKYILQKFWMCCVVASLVL